MYSADDSAILCGNSKRCAPVGTRWSAAATMATSWTSFVVISDLLDILATSWSLVIDVESCKQPACCAATAKMAQRAWLTCCQPCAAGALLDCSEKNPQQGARAG